MAYKSPFNQDPTLKKARIQGKIERTKTRQSSRA